MRDAVPTGSKRKRVVSGSENALANGRSRSGNRVKRCRASHSSGEDEDAASSMDVDSHSRWELTDSDASDDEDVDSCESSCHRRRLVDVYGRYTIADAFLINEAPRRQLLRLRKDDLVRLYAAAGLTEDAELLTKPEIVDCIVDSRDDIASLPPSSPPEAGSSGSSDYSSDGGNVAGGEETDIGNRFRNGLARRNTIHDLGRRNRRPLPSDRCYSLPQLQQSERVTRVASKSIPNGPRRYGCILLLFTFYMLTHVVSRGLSRASSSRSSPTTSFSSTAVSSPPATRTRSRKYSNEDIVAIPIASTSSKGKGKAKQVEFDDQVQIAALTETEPESDLTDLAELEESIGLATPSPRRLRSKGDSRVHILSQCSQDGERMAGGDVDLGRRVTPMRRAKRNVGSLKEDDTEEEEDELIDSDAEDVEAEEDQLAGSPTPKLNRTRRTPLRSRLQPRRMPGEAPSDGDDEESDDESVAVGESVNGEEEEEGPEIDDGETIREDESEEDDSEDIEAEKYEEPPLEPRILRNGKVVGEDDEDEDEVLTEASTEEDAEGEVDDGDLQEQDAASIDLENEDDEDMQDDDDETDEPMDDDGESLLVLR